MDKKILIFTPDAKTYLSLKSTIGFKYDLIYSPSIAQIILCLSKSKNISTILLCNIESHIELKKNIKLIENTTLNIPIVIIGNQFMNIHRIKAEYAQVIDVMPKPIDISKLYKLLDKINGKNKNAIS